MCDTCGCGPEQIHNHTVRDKKLVNVNQRLLKSNEDAAIENRGHFDKNAIFTMNLISSPGSGKTTLLEKTIDAMKDELSIAVLEGDIETELDAERIRAKGVPSVQLTTGGACHLESSLIRKGLRGIEDQMQDETPDLLFIENVGNLVCPSFFDLGEHVRAVLVSIPEGQDKPVKYPGAIRTSQVFVLTKTDLLPYFDFDIDAIKKDALALNPSIRIIETSAKTGDGLDQWFQFLREQRNRFFGASRQ